MDTDCWRSFIMSHVSFSGIRVLDGPLTDSMEAVAFNKHYQVNDVYSCRYFLFFIFKWYTVLFLKYRFYTDRVKVPMKVRTGTLRHDKMAKIAQVRNCSDIEVENCCFLMT